MQRWILGVIILPFLIQCRSFEQLAQGTQDEQTGTPPAAVPNQQGNNAANNNQWSTYDQNSYDMQRQGTTPQAIPTINNPSVNSYNNGATNTATPQPINTNPILSTSDGCLSADQLTCSIEEYVVAFTNDFRRKNNLQPLAHHFKISVVARNWAAQELKIGIISHVGFPFSRTSDYKMKFPGESLPAISAENTAQSGVSVMEAKAIAEGFVNQWINSPGHRVNLLGLGYKSIGAGIQCGTGLFGFGKQCMAVQIFSTSPLQ